ncbi:MAG: fibronectin type III domain-containing protein [Desulfobacteraceae bacterium]|nr:MAG: fibronectin type III domain-containing protein [Desulfobacteraceae bacterium]
MKKIFCLIVFLHVMFLCPSLWADPVIVDHTCTDITAIPQSAIEAAKSNLHIAYGHTSHGSQLISGMGSGLDTFMQNNYGTPAGLYTWNEGGTGGALDIDDGFMPGDLGNPDRTTWAARTRTYLNDPTNADVNVVIWSWCGQADTSIANIDIYLNLMEGLIVDYPDVKFVFMTGHLTGSGATGQLNLANAHIRNHCITNSRILYDFADIESFDPAWLDPSWPGNGTDYMALLANDQCYYDSDGNGSRESNWALAWQAAHTQDVHWWASGAAHSQHLNGNLKGYAAWWLWARLAGWNQCTNAPTDLAAGAGTVTGTVDLTWTDNATDEDGYIVQARFNSGSWDNSYASLPANSTGFTDDNNGTPPLAYGTYTYRVVAHKNAGGGDPACDSFPSNTASIEINNPDIPTPPSQLNATVDTHDGTVDLTWQDNSGNETHFIIQRQVDGGAWNNSYDTVSADTTTYTDDNGSSPPLPSGTYTYRVVAANNALVSAPSNTDSAVLSTTPPQAPDNLASSANGTTVTLTWQDNSSNEESFIVQRKRNNQNFGQIVSLAPGTQTYIDEGLTPNNTYTYRVMARNAYGDSAWSNETSEYVVCEQFTITLRQETEIDDAFLDSGSPDTNYGDTRYRSLERYVVKFDLPPELSGMHILEATVSFYGYGSSWPQGQYLNLYPLNSAWEENQVTWNSWPVGSEGGDFSTGNLLASIEMSSGSDHDFYPPADITGIVRQWVRDTVPNHGIILVNDSGVSTSLKATEYNPNSCTYFTITYTQMPPTVNLAPAVFLLGQ